MGELYGVGLSANLVSVVTEAVMGEVVAWQARPLESTYAIVYFNALRVKVRDEGMVCNKAVYLAIGLRCCGRKEILGLWIEQAEGAKFWMRVMTELKGRGVEDILIAVVDGLKGFPEAITAIFPDTVVQTCIVHLIRNLMKFASWKERKALALDDFEQGLWGEKFPPIVASWRRHWEAGDSVLRVLTQGPQDYLLPPTLSKVCTAKSERPSATRDTSPMMRQRLS